MATTILRVEKIKSMANIRQAGAHQHRHHLDTPNADENLTKNNVTLVGSNNLGKDVQTRLETLSKPPRKNAVLMMEGMMSLSPEAFLKEDGKPDNEALERFVDRSEQWLKDRFGDNLVNCVLHLDESTPHLHFCVVPLDEKPDGRKVLNARDMFDKWKLADMQKEYNSAMREVLPSLEAPKHGSKAQHTKLKHFYAELGSMADQLHQSMLEAKAEMMNEAQALIMERLAPMIERQFQDVEAKLGNPIPEEMRKELMEQHTKKAEGVLGFAFEESKTIKAFEENLIKKINEQKQEWATPKPEKPKKPKRDKNGTIIGWIED